MKKIIFILCLYLQVANAQNNYGEFTYPHSNGSTMSSGITSTVAGQPGFIMAGYNSSAAPYHFTIDRTDMGGAFTGSTFEFQKDYSVFADVTGGCILSNTVPVNSSHAVSIIQTPLSVIGARYALVGAFDEGCYLCFIDGAGSVINTNIFWFPFPPGTNPSTITKPIIKEDGANLGNYFICGSYSNIMYAMSIDYNGVPNWTQTYSIVGHPNDMIESGSDMVIVGQTTTSNVVPDGFVMKIVGTGSLGGTVSYFRVYDDASNYYQNFSCVAPTSTPGLGSYIIGGSCEVSPGIFGAYNLNVNGGGLKNWDNVIISNADATAVDFVGIVERNTNVAGFIEYYGIMTSTVGIIVSKMNYTGTPVYNGTGTPFDEFVYNAPGVNITATGISCLNNLSSYDVGLHIFGTDQNSNTQTHYLAQAYFSGNNGCNNPGFHFSSTSTICTSSSTTIATGGGLSPCNAIKIIDGSNSSKINYCGPSSTAANGSNARLTEISEFQNESEKTLFVFANPIEKSIFATCKNCGEISSIYISDILGQQVFNLRSASEITNSSSPEKIKVTNLNLQTGSYILTVKSSSGLQSSKFMYSSD